MGSKDSSKTRVAPVFGQLLARDPSGASWLDAVIGLGSRTAVTATVPRGLRLVPAHGERWGKNEAALPAPQSLLLYLIENVAADRASRPDADNLTAMKRNGLASQDPATIREAREAILAGRRGKQWFILEGDSRPDALLETEQHIICVEGKRTEAACTTETEWMSMRSQLLRHMDAAVDRYPGKRILGLLIVEGEGEMDALQASEHWAAQSAMQHEEAMIRGSLPHRSASERRDIADGVLGVTTWQAVCAATGLDWASLPDLI